MSSDSPASILFDESGNPVGVSYDGYTYRLQVEATLSDGYETIGIETKPIRNDPTGNFPQPVVGVVVAEGNAPQGSIYHGYPHVGAGIDSNNIIQIIDVDSYGAQTFKTKTSTSPTVTNIPDNNVNVTLLLSNINRKGATLYNDSTATLFLVLGTNASPSNYTVKLFTDSYYEVPFSYTGNIDGIWSATTGVGFVMVTELV